MFHFSNYSPNLIYWDDLNEQVVDKIKDETAGVAIEELVGLIFGLIAGRCIHSW